MCTPSPTPSLSIQSCRHSRKSGSHSGDTHPRWFRDPLRRTTLVEHSAGIFEAIRIWKRSDLVRVIGYIAPRKLVYSLIGYSITVIISWVENLGALMKARNVSIVHVDYVIVCSAGNNEMCHLCECCSPRSEDREKKRRLSLCKVL